MSSIYEQDLGKNAANFTPQTPLDFLSHAERVYPQKAAVVHGDLSYSYREFARRCRRLASALKAHGVGLGDTVSVMAPNVPALLEAHYAVPMLGGVLNALNYRLDAPTIAFILNHAQSKVLITDTEFSPVIKDALAQLGRDIVVLTSDLLGAGGERLGVSTMKASSKLLAIRTLTTGACLMMNGKH